jgi:prephenate dehydrogenase
VSEEERAETAPRLSSATVAIVGLGLMGGSMAMALKQGGHCAKVVGVARRAETISQAMSLDAIDEGHTEMETGVADADVVVLAVPVRTIIEFIPRIGRWVNSGCLITDMGSTKRLIVKAMSKLPRQVQALGGHPMCGKETSGLGVAEPDLFRGATYALTPLERTSPESVALGQELAQAVSARPLVIEPDSHDRLVATISHLPYLLAASLVATACEIGDDDARVWDLAASGFRDTSRVAASDLKMMIDILITNRAAIEEMVGMAQANLKAFLDMVITEDETALRNELELVQRQRASMYTGG